jgi:hypothetical protein
MALPTSMLRISFPLFFVVVSFFGLLIISVIALSPPVSQEDFVWRKPLIGSLFASVCVLGILAVFFPNECSKVFDFGKEGKRRSKFLGFKRGVAISKCDSPLLRGHHPTCGQFSSHVFRVGGKVFCATCSGLFLGALLVLVGVASQFLGSWQIGLSAFLLVWVGIIGVILGLLQSLVLTFHRSVVRVFSSAFLAIGSYLILVGIDELANNVFLDVFLIFLTVFWLMTRISLSEWEHEKICSKCNLSFCNFEQKNRS